MTVENLTFALAFEKQDVEVRARIVPRNLALATIDLYKHPDLRKGNLSHGCCTDEIAMNHVVWLDAHPASRYLCVL